MLMAAGLGDFQLRRASKRKGKKARDKFVQLKNLLPPQTQYDITTKVDGTGQLNKGHFSTPRT